jgi:hypothetical protein
MLGQQQKIRDELAVFLAERRVCGAERAAS